MTLSHHQWQCIRHALTWALVLLIIACLLVALSGCRSMSPMGSWSIWPWNWGGGPDPAAPADPTQGQVAAGVSKPLSLVSGILLLSAAGFLILAKDVSRAALSAGGAVVLIIINGAVITLLKNSTAVWILLGVTGLVTLLWLMKDGIDLTKLEKEANGWNGSTKQSPSDGQPPADSSSGSEAPSTEGGPNVVGTA